jgi:hypothetical protein
MAKAVAGFGVHRKTGRVVIPPIKGVLVVALTVLNAVPTMSQSFQPIRNLTTWYTDRRLVDIEIIGSTSLWPDRHQLQPERMLRFRLERAYVQTLIAERDPGFEIVNFSFDMETGLADALIIAVSRGGRFHEDISGVPRMSQAERLKRGLLIALQSDEPAAALQRGSEGVAKCRGARITDDLLDYDWQGQSDCRRPSLPKGSRYIAVYNDLTLGIECREEKFRGIGCHIRYPFEGFAVKIGFHRDHLLKWREMIERTNEFLRSKQYR